MFEDILGKDTQGRSRRCEIGKTHNPHKGHGKGHGHPEQKEQEEEYDSSDTGFSRAHFFTILCNDLKRSAISTRQTGMQATETLYAKGKRGTRIVAAVSPPV